MNDKLSSPISRFITPSVILALVTAIIWLIVEVKKIPTIDQRLDKKIAIQNQMHTENDKFKIETIKENYELKLSIKDEKIERLEAEVEFYKNK